MTGQTDDLVAVNVHVSSLVDAHTCDTVSHVVDGGTVSDLRVVLVQDGVIRFGDGSAFTLPGGRIVGKSSEDHLKWHSLLENDEVHVLLVPAPTADLSDGLSVTAASDIFDDDKHLASATAGSPSIAPQDRDLGELRLNERLSIVRKSKLGEGINVCDDHGPQFSGHSVIADIDPSTIRIMDIDGTQYEAIVTSSARTAAYLSAGWTMPAINSIEFARSGQWRSNSTSTIWVTGRYLLSSCQLTLPGAHIMKPHPELQAAVDKALAERDPARREQKLDAVWQCYGHVYVDSVEMGEMRYLNGTVETVDASDQIKQDFLRGEMMRTLRKTFEFQDDIQAPKDMYHDQRFERVGGLKHSENIRHRKSSLTQSANWAVTRTLRVVPVVELFDEEIQNKIAANASPPKLDVSTTVAHTFEMGLVSLASGKADTTSKVAFVEPFDTPPSVFMGILRLDFHGGRVLRVKGEAQSATRDRAALSIHTSSDTIHWRLDFCWLAVTSDDPDIQHGTFETSQRLRMPAPQRTRRIDFECPYNATPKVIVWLHYFNLDSDDERIRITTYATDVSRNGFVLHLDTWDGSSIWAAGVSWLAHSVSRTDFASGTYDTRDVRPADEPRTETHGHVGFNHAQFHRRPTSVFTALREFDISKTTNPRLSLSTDKVTETGMDWHIDTWMDTTLYSAGVSFIAF